MTESIPLIRIDKKDECTNFVFGRGVLKKLQELLLSDDVKDRSVVVISVTGALRTGKSFLLSFFLKYLRHMYSDENSQLKEESWLGNEEVPLKGFEWKGGMEPVTTGIQMWPEIFRTTLPDGEKVAIILLDTQGMFDSDTTFEVNTKIFALSTMISSLNVYNLRQRIMETDLQFLKFCTDFASVAMKVRGDMLPNAPFEKMLFLVRDYACGQQTGYGYAGGRRHKNAFLEIKEDQKPELKSVRRLINLSFCHVDGFVMPHPGYDVTESSEFDGRLSGIRRPFRKCLEELVPSLLSPENLIPKKIEGHKVTGAKLFQYLALYVNKLNSDEMPSPRSIFEANSEMSFRLAFEKAISTYLEQMEVVCGLQYVGEDVFAKHHEACRQNAYMRFSNYPKFEDGNAHAIYETKLNEEINRLYVSYSSSNKIKKEVEELKSQINSPDREQNRTNQERINELQRKLEKEQKERQNDRWFNNLEQIIGRVVTLGIPYLIRRWKERKNESSAATVCGEDS